MARPKSKITKSDHLSAKAYIQNAMDRGDISSVDGYIEFRNADTPERLQSWCETYLDDDQWHNMKTAIRVQRKRYRDYKSPKRKISIDLDKDAWLLINSMAKEEGRTLSEMVKAYDDVYGKAKAAGIVADI